MTSTLEELETIVDRLTKRIEELEREGAGSGRESKQNFIKEQRKFLHDISSPVSIANGMIEICLEQLEKSPVQFAPEIDRLKKALKALQKLTVLIQQNRELLVMAA
jgi:hypothetical protein